VATRRDSARDGVIVAVSAVTLGAAAFVGGLIGAALDWDAKRGRMGIWLGATARSFFLADRIASETSALRDD